MQLRRFAAWIVVSLFSLPSFAPAAEIETRPPDGLRSNTPTLHALVGARIVVSTTQVIERGTLVVDSGRIVAVGADVAAPAGARIWNLEGRTIYPGLIDAYGELADGDSVANSVHERGAPYWNGEVTPQLDAAAHYKPDEGLNKKLRGQGVALRLIAPPSGIVRGASAVVSTADGPGAQTILREQVAQHVVLTLPRGGRDRYPNSPMGALTLARQAFYDAAWYDQAWQVFNAATTVERPERNDALAALAPQIRGQRPVIFDISDELYFLRADRFAREFGLQAIIHGSGHEYRQLEAVKQAGRPVILPVRFPKPPHVGTIETAHSAALEDLLHWDLAPENPGRLAKAGVKIALTSHGLADAGDFLKAVRRAVRRGLSKEDALRALTTIPAELLGVSERAGTLEAGRAANVLVTSGDLFDDNTEVLETWIDGNRYEIEPTAKIDLRGSWRLVIAPDTPEQIVAALELSGEPLKLSGKLQRDDKSLELKNLGFDHGRFTASFNGQPLSREGAVRISGALRSAATDALALAGDGQWADGASFAWTATRSIGPKEAEKSKPKVSDIQAKFAVNYPLGAFGRLSAPEQPEIVAFTGATVWTSGPAGNLEKATVIVERGKIVAVGTDLAIPANAKVIDCTGKHLSPGIIDCHSHIATDGGVNESGQAITAEVRIGDFIDSSDIEIYRQLAGGVTAANILHGSANPIGGQNQVIKFRWGALGDELKFADAPPGIKFALGENVKQSNWGERFTSRYPQSRMGVEQIVRDAFLAARQYRAKQHAWRERREGLPPRVDLELEAIAEIVEGKRLIHCHSYRQDEILALLRTCQEFGVQIATLQHILEGYKVADEMARQGVMGSTFSDWWAYKFEVFDAIPFNGALMRSTGVVVSFNSDDAELARRLNLEAAKAVKYGGVPPADALQFVTLNPAKQLRIDNRVGSLEPGKDADLVVWSGSPLSGFSRCEQTWVDGRKYFDLEEDRTRRAEAKRMHAALVQKVLTSGDAMRAPGEEDPASKTLWPRTDAFCRAHNRVH
jgi:N-acetylglucosamine-6-phosphate deacetylase